MNIHSKVNLFLSALRGDAYEQELGSQDTAKPIIEEVFGEGNCGNLCVMLALAFNGQPMKGEHHYVTKIGSRLYDIYGDVTNKYSEQHFEPVSIEQVTQCTMYSNYSFNFRGPLV